MLDIDYKELMRCHQKACEISRLLESKQYLNFYEDEENYNLFISDRMIQEMVMQRADVENYQIIDSHNTLYLFALTSNSVYGLHPYEIKNKFITQKNKKSETILVKLIILVFLQYFSLIEAKQDLFINVKKVYPLEQFIESLDATFDQIKTCNKEDEDFLFMTNAYGNIVDVAKYWDKMGNTSDSITSNNGFYSKRAFVHKLFKTTLVGENEHNSLVVLNGDDFRPTRRAIAFISSDQAESLRERIQHFVNVRNKGE